MPATHVVVDGPIGIETPSAAFPIPEKVVCDLNQEWVVEGMPRTVTNATFKGVFGVERVEFASLKDWMQERKVRLDEWGIRDDEMVVAALALALKISLPIWTTGVRSLVSVGRSM